MQQRADMANQEEVSTKLCSNCKRDIPALNYVMHQNHCQRNIKLCEHCDEPVPTLEMDAHFEEEHKKVQCKCGESIEKCQVEDHEAKHCAQRSIKCEYCEIDLPFAEIGEHKDFCGSRTELCPKCSRYIQFKDQDVHDVSECTYPEAQPKPKSKPSNMHTDQFEGIDAAIFSTEWPGMWDTDVRFLPGSNVNAYPAYQTVSDVFKLTSPSTQQVWSPLPQAVPHQDRRKNSREEIPDRKHRKNLDRVQNSFGVTRKKKTMGSSLRPWEKNEERQQNISQEESDRQLAMHLAQELKGEGLSPTEHPALNSQDVLPSTGGMLDAQIDQMIKDAYDIPTVNSYQESNFTQSTSPDVSHSIDVSLLPCEFCQKLIPSKDLIQHQTGCRPDVASFLPAATLSTNNNRHQTSQGLSVRPHVLDNLGQDPSPEWLSDVVQARKPSVDAEEDSIMLPCEFCGDLLPAEFLAHHQVNCTDNGPVNHEPSILDCPSPKYPNKFGQSSPNMPPSSRVPILTSPVNHEPSILDCPSPKYPNKFGQSSPKMPPSNRVPIPTSLDLSHRPVKHQPAPNVDVLMVSPDSQPTKDKSSPQLRHAGPPKCRKSKVTSTVTRPAGHGVNLTLSPVDKYLNNTSYGRDLSVSRTGAKPRVVTGKPTKKPCHTPASPNINDLNNRQKQAGDLRTKPLRNSAEGTAYEPSFVGNGEKRKVNREKNSLHSSNKPSIRSKNLPLASVVKNKHDDDDDLAPLRLNRCSNQATSGTKPKQRRKPKKPDDAAV